MNDWRRTMQKALSTMGAPPSRPSSPLSPLYSCFCPNYSHWTGERAAPHDFSWLGPHTAWLGLHLWRKNSSNPEGPFFSQELGLRHIEFCESDFPRSQAPPGATASAPLVGLWIEARMLHPLGLLPPTALGAPPDHNLSSKM